MSEYTTREILDMIEANGGPEGLDLSGRDLSGIDLSNQRVWDVMRLRKQEHLELQPPYWTKTHKHLDWLTPRLSAAETWGLNLKEADLNRTELEGARFTFADLEQANLKGANMRGATLIGVNLRCTNLIGVDLREAMLLGADMEGVDLRYSDVSGVDLRDGRNLLHVQLYRASLDHTQLSKDQLGGRIAEEENRDWKKAKETYLTLKNNFDQIGRYDDASWAYRKERRMEKREAWEKAGEAFQRHDWTTVVSKTWKVEWDLVVEYLCDYGESVGRVLGWMGFLLFIAGPLLFGLPGLLRWPPETRDTFFNLRPPLRYAYAYLQQFLYVLDAFTTASFAQLQPATALTRGLSGVTALLGVFLTGLLGFVTGNRIRRS